MNDNSSPAFPNKLFYFWHIELGFSIYPLNISRKINFLSFFKKCFLALFRQKEKPSAILIYMDSCSNGGLHICNKLKTVQKSNPALLFLISSDDGEVEIVRALQSGADAFLPRLHGPRELLARLEAMQRLIKGTKSGIIKCKDIEIDLYEQKVSKSEKQVRLTYIQFKLLSLLISKRDKIFSREEIKQKIWGNKNSVSNRTIDVHIKRLRRKLGEVKYPSQYIETIHGYGYQFVN